MSVVAIDIDQTLYDFDSQVREAFFEMAIEKGEKSLLRGAYSINMEWRNLTDVAGLDVALEAIHRVHDRTLDQTPFPGSVEAVSKIWANNHTIKYVTSRRECYYSDTLEWLLNCGYPSGEVICSEHDKSEHLVDCQYLIDDRPRTIINFITDYAWRKKQLELRWENPRLAFGLWTPYNRNLTDIKNVLLAPTWRGIEFYLERKGII